MPPLDIIDIEKEWLDELTTIDNLWNRLRRYWELLPIKAREGREQNAKTQRRSRAARKASKPRLNRVRSDITGSDSGTSFVDTETLQQHAITYDKPKNPFVKKAEVLGLPSYSSMSESSLPSIHITGCAVPGKASACRKNVVAQKWSEQPQTVAFSRLPKHVSAPSDIWAMFKITPSGIECTGERYVDEKQLRDIANMLAICAVDKTYLETTVLPLCRRYLLMDRESQLTAVMGYFYLAKWGRECSEVETMAQLMIPENEEEEKFFLKSWLDMGEQWLRDDRPIARCQQAIYGITLRDDTPYIPFTL
ncbi:hypothetical protein NliqN6_3362 [Naganishia liquefaciens]|uniref:Uncharacterized protein n=1 Tax=Naganishia liquefaciens TaxID=104408 RepID=A0A8H3TTI2_9TREE|nr:hypothetical protein NliqN6_3362 [Naganishia liquefaciens]